MEGNRLKEEFQLSNIQYQLSIIENKNYYYLNYMFHYLNNSRKTWTLL